MVPRLRLRSAFTLIELLVVIVIIAVLTVPPADWWLLQRLAGKADGEVVEASSLAP